MAGADTNNARPQADLDALWAGADIPADDRDAWRHALAYSTSSPDDAVRLSRLGWTPAQVIAARTDESLFGPVGEDEEAIAAAAALAHETARYHESKLRVARAVRTEHLLTLADRLPKAQRWRFGPLGDLLGLSAQRVRGMLRSQG